MDWGPGLGARQEKVQQVYVSAAEEERHTDVCKLDPEREIAGGKLPVLLLSLQV